MKTSDMLMTTEVVNDDDANANPAVQSNDEPYDFLEEWTSPMHVPRSKSWFCCSNDNARDVRQPNMRRRPLSCHYSIVRTEPKSQSDIVNPLE